MTDPRDTNEGNERKPSFRRRNASRTGRTRQRRRLIALLVSLGVTILLAMACAAWLGNKAFEINDELAKAVQLVPALKNEIAANDADGAASKVAELRNHTAAAKSHADDPIWTLVSTLPVLGPNFSAVAEVARSADDVANLGVKPLVNVYSSLDWMSLVPTSEGSNLAPLQTAAPSIASSAHAVRLSADRLNAIDSAALLPQVAEPLIRAKDQLQEISGALDAAADAADVMPSMLGADEPRNYLLMVQNNAESRASGGIPGALAILNIENGKMSLSSQSSAADVGAMSPIVSLDLEQQHIYSSRLGKFMQDVNLTPDFPSAARTAQAMWERKTGQRADGVISIDPVALGYILTATGPVTISQPDLLALASRGLPTEFTGENVVPTLLSSVYAKIEEPELQDAYFAGVAQEVFAALSTGAVQPKGLVEGISRAAQEGRVLIWSTLPAEQSVIAKHPLSGSITGPSVAPAQFGVYFNDGTGAKMDYYVRRTVQLLKECAQSGYEQTTVRITSTNTAPPDAAASLPRYVTGGGAFGVAPGSVQTNIVAYGPVQAHVETVMLDGQKTHFAPHLHSNRPVGVVAIRLAPGESRTVDVTFGKIVQHTEPNVVVTPTVQPVNEVVLPTKSASCS